MVIEGEGKQIVNYFNEMIEKSKPKMLSENYTTNFPVHFCSYDENDKRDAYHILVSVFFTDKPVYIFGIVNLNNDTGSLRLYNEYSFETFLYEIVRIVLTNFKNSTFRHKRGIIIQMGKELSEHLIDFNGKTQFIDKDISEDIYSALTDVDIIEDYMEFHKNSLDY